MGGRTRGVELVGEGREVWGRFEVKGMFIASSDGRGGLSDGDIEGLWT